MHGRTVRTLALLAILFAALAGLPGLTAGARPAGPMPASRSKEAPAGPTDLNELSLEVAALKTLHRLQLTSAQLQVLAQTEGLAVKGEARQPAKTTGRYRKALVDLRAALIRGEEKQIDELHDRLDELETEDQPDLDDGVEISARARTLAGDFLRLLTPRQVMRFLADREEVPDLRLLILTAIVKGRSLNGEAWKELRDEAAEEAADLLAGVREAEHKRALETVTALLDAGRRYRENELEKLKTDTDAAVARLVGGRGPLELLRNVLERDLAELLSNPRLPASVQVLLASRGR